MELFTSTKIFEIKTLLLIREDVKRKISDQQGYIISHLNSATLNKIAERIVENVSMTTGINAISERALRMYLLDKITDQTTLPHLKNGKSIVDLICKYLGFVGGLAEYQGVKSSEIKNIKCQASTVYTLSEVKSEAKVQDQNHYPDIEYFTGYYYAYFRYVHPAVIVLDHQTNIMELHLSKIEPYSEGFLYLGPFEISKEGYLTYFGTLQNFDRAVTICIRVYYDDLRKNYKYYIGTYVGTSLQDYDNIAGINLFEKPSSFEDAKAKWNHIDERILKFLQGKRVVTKRKGFYSIDELLASH